MIKNMVKSVLAVMLAVGTVPTASAEVKPYGFVITHFGHYSNSTKTNAYNSDGSTAAAEAEGSRFASYYTSKVGLEFKQEDFTAKAAVSSRTGNTNANKTTAKVDYKATENIQVTMGTSLTPAGSIGYTITGGYLGSNENHVLDLNITNAGLAYIEHPGMIVKYAINPYMAVYAGLYSKNTLFNNWIGVPEAVAIATASSCANCSPAVTDSGSGNSLSFQGMLSKQLLVGAAYLTSTRDNYNGLSTDTASAINLTGMYFMGDITLAADYASSERSYFSGIENAFGDTVDGKSTITDMGILVKMKDMGPGEIGVKYASLSLKASWAGTDIDAASYDQTNTHLHYQMPACKKACTIGFLYESLTKTAKSSGADAITTTFIGGSFAAKF